MNATVMRMLRWMSGYSLRDRMRIECICEKFGKEVAIVVRGSDRIIVKLSNEDER